MDVKYTYIHIYIYIYIYSRLRRLRRLIVVRFREEVDSVRFVDRLSSVSSVSSLAGGA